MRKFFSLPLVAVCFHVQAALAVPFLTPTVLGDNQVIGPTDTASFTIRLTNTGDAPFIWTGVTSVIQFPSGYDFNDGIAPNSGNVAVGGFLDIPAHFFPSLGGPVAPGQYMSNFDYDFSFSTTFIQSVNTTAHWTVATVVPEPPLLALLGLGLAGLGFSRRKK